MTKNQKKIYKHQCNWCWHWFWHGFKQWCQTKKINVITGTINDPSAFTSRTGGTQDDPSELTSRAGDTNKLSDSTPDKGHSKNLVTSFPLQKYRIRQIERTKPHGSKPHYKGSDNSYIDRLHDE